jgi:hypothetical protein
MESMNHTRRLFAESTSWSERVEEFSDCLDLAT